eukprot:764585-Hanusia_phi.AAC.5
MKYVLGKTMVCKDVEAAKSCAFNDGIRVKVPQSCPFPLPHILVQSVTLEGDLFDPAGTLTGGTRAPTSSSILTKFGDLLDKKEELEKREKKLRPLKAQVTAAGEWTWRALTAKVRRRKQGKLKSSIRPSHRSSHSLSTSPP